MRKFIILLGLCLIANPLLALDYSTNNQRLTKDYEKNNLVKAFGGEYTNGLTKGLTFYVDYSNRTLTAIQSRGSPNAQFSLSTGIVVWDKNGVSCSTVRAEVLKYEIAKNRTASQETIAIKFEPSSNFANDGVEREITDTDIKRRLIRKATTGTAIQIFANATDSVGIATSGDDTISANISYVMAITCNSAGNPSSTLYVDGVQDGTSTTSAFTVNTWGTYFYVGSKNDGTVQLNGLIQKVAIWDRPLSATEVLMASNLIRGN